jgi:hypothetical protein
MDFQSINRSCSPERLLGVVVLVHFCLLAFEVDDPIALEAILAQIRNHLARMRFGWVFTREDLLDRCHVRISRALDVWVRREGVEEYLSTQEGTNSATPRPAVALSLYLRSRGVLAHYFAIHLLRLDRHYVHNRKKRQRLKHKRRTRIS